MSKRYCVYKQYRAFVFFSFFLSSIVPFAFFNFESSMNSRRYLKFIDGAAIELFRNLFRIAAYIGFIVLLNFLKNS